MVGRVKQLWQDERDRKVEQYLLDHPWADEEDAYVALFEEEDD